ncbi:hypothetical protein HDU84_009526 [Entophlyctis sp. JEL0112]|nr:hypothetical protein HDU84_009526 [Entophlyctis sp. JEL0112]
MSSNGYRSAEQREYTTPVRGVSMTPAAGRPIYQPQSQQQVQPPINQLGQLQPSQKKGLFAFGRKKEDPVLQVSVLGSHRQFTLSQPQSSIPPSQPQDMNRSQKRMSSDNKRSSVEKRLSGYEKRLSADPTGFATSKRASLELKLHDGMIIVDEEDRNRLLRKNSTSSQKDNQSQYARMPVSSASPNQTPSQLAKLQQYETMLQPSPQKQSQPQLRPPTNLPRVQLNGSQTPSFQGPPRQGSLNNSTLIQRGSPQIPPQQYSQQSSQLLSGQPLGKPAFAQGPLMINRSSPIMTEQLQSHIWVNGSERTGKADQFDPIALNNDVRPGVEVSATEDDQFSEVVDDESESDEESAGSFLSFDDETEDNTEYNAIVDYDLLDTIMGGSTDYDAPMPRASHSRKVVFNTLVKAQSLVRAGNDGDPAPNFDPDTDTELEPGDDDADDEDDEDEVWNDSPPSPVVEVVNMLPLQIGPGVAAEIPPEITPRGVSLKLNNSSSSPSGTGTDPSTGNHQESSAIMQRIPETPKKRHVQIQTRAAIMRHEFTMTDLSIGDIDETQLRQPSAQLDGNGMMARVEEELQFLRSQNQMLQDTITQMQADAAEKQVRMEEATAKFERLSGQATKKIKELVADRKVLEIEIEGLKEQVTGLEALVEKWTLEDS